MITEDQLEQLCLDWFKSIGYDYICGYDIALDGEDAIVIYQTIAENVL